MQEAAELKPDLIILDLAMPQMDGLQAASQISAAFPDVPILIYTNLAVGPGAKIEAKKCGVREIINKSSDPGQLLSAIESLRTQPQAAVKSALAATNSLDPALQKEAKKPDA